MQGDFLIALALLIPVAGAIGIWLTGARANLREAVTLITAGALFAVVVLGLAPMVLGGARPELALVRIFGGIEIAMKIEPLGMLFACIASTLWIVNSIYSIGYMRANEEPRQTPFYILFAVAIWSAIGIAFSANLFTLFLFYEILTLSTYPLVAHHGDAEARAKGRVYLLLLISTSMMLLLPAIIWVFALTGTTAFVPGGILAGAGLSSAAIAVLLALFIFGIAKAAVMPVHFWLPAAMVAPTPVSALLHAVAVVKAGVFTVVKVIVYTFGADFLDGSGGGDWLLYVAGFTVIAASVVALMQDNLKMRLAYSTVSQLSYIVLAAAILTPISLIGAALHIAVHAVSKITLFFAAGSIYTASHLTLISQLDGIGRRMPWTMGAFAIASLSMIGLPPTAGFVSKWFMLQGAGAAESWFAIGVLALSTVLNACYFLPIVWRAFWRAPPPVTATRPAHGEEPGPVVLALVITALGTLALFFLPGPALDLARAMMAEAPK